MLVDYQIMHAPWSDREHWLAAILARVPSAKVVRDTARSVWDTAKRAWLAGLDSGASHVMVLQDDMIPVDDFAEVMGVLCADKPNAAISVFSIPAVGWAQEMDYAKDRSTGWRSCGPYFWGGSVCLPSARVREMVEACDEMSGLSYNIPDAQVDDVRISRWAAKAGIECAHWYPQLLEHVGYDKSLIGSPPESWRKGT